MATWVATPVVLDGKTGPTGPGGSSSGATMISVGWDSGGTGAVLRSLDRGVTWSDVGLTGISASRATAVAYNGITWVLSTDSETLSSNDGVSWTVESGGFAAATFIKWNGKQFIASTSDSGTVTVYTSANGLSWTSKPVPGLTGQAAGGLTDPVLSDVASDGSKWVGALDGVSPNGYPFIVSTDNGVTWNDDGITGASGFMQRAYGISYAEGVWMATGSSLDDAKTSIMRSTDGLVWSPAASAVDTGNFGMSGGAGSYVVSNGVQWLAVGGGDTGSPTILVSDDNGLTWDSTGVTGDINQPSSPAVYFNSVKWNGFYWVAVGTPPNQITYSLDGLTWNGATGGPFPGNYVGEVATDYIQAVLGGVGNAGGGGAGSVGPTGARGTVIFYGYGVPEGICGYVGPTGPTGYGPTGDAFGPQKTGDFYLNFEDGRLYLTP